jgi:protein-disulfide isomerase
MVNPDPNQPAGIPSKPPRAGSTLSACCVWLAVSAGLILSIVSVLKICSACSETAAFTIFGMDFGWFGIAYFLMLAALLFIRRWWPGADWLVIALLFAAAGAESRFIWLQKYVIGQWCPVCLWIAASVYFGSAAKLFETSLGYNFKGAGMKSRVRLFTVVLAMTAIGLAGAILGVKKESEAAELDLFLGKAKSPVTVYFVSDWFCPGCRKIEPAIEKMFPEIARSAKVGFVDFPIHKETLNFTPFNLQFLYFEKDKYIPLRRALGELAAKTKNPTPEEVQAAVAPLGVKLRQVNYSDILYGMQANLAVYRGFNVHSTPSVVVTNTKTNKTKILVGDRQISEQAVKAAMEEVGK